MRRRVVSVFTVIVLAMIALAGCASYPYRDSLRGGWPAEGSRDAVTLYFCSETTPRVKIYRYMPTRGFGEGTTDGATLYGPLRLWRGPVTFKFSCPAPAATGEQQTTLTFERAGVFYLYCSADGVLAYAPSSKAPI